MRRHLGTTAIIVLAAALAGCGNERTPVPDVRHADAPQGSREVELRAAGLEFKAPVNWPDLAAQGSRAGGIQSKTATLAIWRYLRTEPLPTGDDELAAAKGRLEERVKQRDPSWQVTSSTVTRRGGAPAIELVGRQTVAGLPFAVRSTHVFKDGAEIVLDAYAPPEDFDRVDRTVFQPVLDSLKVTAP